MGEVVQMIKDVGFPIMCVIALGYFYNKQFAQFTESINRFNETMLKFDSKLDTLIDVKKGEE